MLIKIEIEPSFKHLVWAASYTISAGRKLTKQAVKKCLEFNFESYGTEFCTGENWLEDYKEEIKIALPWVYKKFPEMQNEKLEDFE